MTAWFVTRRQDGSIAAAYQTPQDGVATESLDDTTDELKAWFAAIRDPVPVSVKAAGMMRALDAIGKLAAVDAAANAAGDLTLALWNRAGTFERADPMVAAIAAAIGMDSAGLDALFRSARSFEAS